MIKKNKMAYKKILNMVSLFLIILTFFSICINVVAQNKSNGTKSIDKSKEMLKHLKTEADKEEIDITVKSLEISKFPEIRLIIEAYNKLGEPLDTLTPDQISIYENGVEFTALSVEKIPTARNLPWDFVFVIDITGSMQPQIDGVMQNLTTFTKNLKERGIDYQLGLILFSDNIERVYQPTTEVDVFLSWLKNVTAYGGGDEKENILEALDGVATRIKFRKEANRVAILVTDAPYHQKGESGDGRTTQTTESIIEKMQRHDIRIFTIAPPKFKNYYHISEKTRGTNYDIAYSFTSVLENFTRQITNLFRVTYLSTKTTIPDSIEIGLFDEQKSRLIKKTIPIIELGRKLIIENLLFNTAKYDLPENVSELNILSDFMVSKPNISIIIEGHTDSTGSHQVNDVLSGNRAESVKKYLILRGVNADRVQTTGFGKRKPIASNETEFGKRLNRRTEIIIISK